MRVLHLMAGAAHGGAETACIDLCVAQKEAGMDVAAALRPHPERQARLEAAGIAVRTMPFGGMLDGTTRPALRRLIREFQPRIVQTWMGRAASFAPAWSASSGAPRYAVVARLGGYYPLKRFRSADAFVTITPDIRQYLIGQGVEPGRIRHINNFAETETAATPASRDALDTPKGAPLLLALGRLHRAKAFDVLLRALADVPDAWLWIAGEGPERAALAAQSAQLGLNGRVRFLGWRDDRAALFQAADICVFPSRYEPFGTVFVQAWAQGLPLIAAAADGPRQYVRDGEDGLLVPIEDAPALAAALRRMIGDAGLRGGLTACGLVRYHAEFSRDHCVAAYSDFYGSLSDPNKF